MRRALIVYLAALLAAGLGGADVLELEGGDALSGSVVRVVDNTLVFRCTLSGQMMVPMDTVGSLSTSQDLVITMKNGDTVYGRLAREDGANRLHPLDGGEARAIDLAAIQEAVAIPAPVEGKPNPTAGARATWSASASAGAEYRAGNHDEFEPFTRLEVSRTGPATEMQSELLLEPQGSEDFPELLRGAVSLNGVDGAGPRPYGELRAERNASSALNLRTDLSLGLLWPLDKKPGDGFSGRAGLNVAYEDWDGSLSRAYRHPGARDKTSDTSLNLHLGLRYARSALRGEVRESLSLYPSLSDFGDVRLRSDTSYTVPFTPRLRLRLDLLVDYDNSLPFPGFDAWETTLGASIHVDF